MNHGENEKDSKGRFSYLNRFFHGNREGKLSTLIISIFMHIQSYFWFSLARHSSSLNRAFYLFPQVHGLSKISRYFCVDETCTILPEVAY